MRTRRHPPLASPHGACPRCGAGLRRQVVGLQAPNQRFDDWDDVCGCIITPDSRQLECPDCQLGLGRFYWRDISAGIHLGPDRLDFAERPFKTWQDFQWAVLRSINMEYRAMAQDARDHLVPQQSCCFRFGPQARPLTVGALFRLWERDRAARPNCPNCDGPGRAEGVGGLINVGGYRCRCLHCGFAWMKQIGGLGVLMKRVRSHLEGTPWYLNGACFGAAVGSDGAALGKALELPGWEGPVEAAQFSMRVGQLDLRLDLNEP